MYQRIIAIVPMVGSGTAADPLQPKYAPVFPAASTGTAVRPTSILGFTMILSDEGNFALMEIVATDQSAFAAMLADTSIQTFLKGRDSLQSAEAAFQKLKKNFSIATFGLRMVVP
jgi:hypothetical protein